MMICWNFDIMNEDQARIIRIYQYLLANDVFLKQQIIDRQKRAQRKNPHPDDVLALWIYLIKLEIWEEFAGELWKLIK